MMLKKNPFESINSVRTLCMLPIALVALLIMGGCRKSESDKAIEEANSEAPKAATRTTITGIEQAVKIFAMRNNGKLPGVLEDLTPELWKKESIIDSWGTPFVYSKNGNSFKISSAGPDRRLGTKDDITN